MSTEVLTKIGEKAEWGPMSESGDSGGFGTEIIDGRFDDIENPTAIIFENGETYATVCQKAKENPNIVLRMNTDYQPLKCFWRLMMLTCEDDGTIIANFATITYGVNFSLKFMEFNNANTQFRYYSKEIT